MDNQQLIRTLVDKARAAQRVLETYNQQQVDELVRVTAKVIYDNAEELARMAVQETRMGVYEDKVKKNQGKARIIWNHLKGKKSVGVLRVLDDEGIMEIAKPMGVIGAVTPCTNPIVTPMCNAMFAYKCRNAIIIAPHPRAIGCTARIAELYWEAFDRIGAPRDLFQFIPEKSLELTNMLMQSADVVLATGGMSMVKAAYASGKPSYGVGAGNVQCIIDRGMDLDAAVPQIIAGRIFDNGIICSGEQTVIAPRDEYDRVMAKFVENGAYYVDDKETVDRIREVLFPDGVMNKYAVGQSAARVAQMCGLTVPEGTKLIIVKPEGTGKSDLFSKEKMCPVLSAYAWDTWEEAVDIAYQNLEVEGMGHSVSIHSDDAAHIEYAGLRLPVCRIVINQICSTMNGGSFFNGLNPTTTLGCGSWGNNSISENLSYTHLMNITRVAARIPGAAQPSDEEIWGE